MTRGAKPKPTALKRLEGNPGRRPLNQLEPRPRADFPRMPRGLHWRARRELERIKRQCAKLGLITPLDANALAAYCQSYATWREAERELAKGTLVIEGARGPIANPLTNIAHKAQASMRYWMVELGFTPSSRSRVTIVAPAERDPIEEFLEQSDTMREFERNG